MGGRKIIDETGNVYGRLTVLGLDKKAKRGQHISARWMCQCECGTVRSVSGQSLRDGQDRCGRCSRRIDLTGQRFGRLTVTTDTGARNGKGFWLCVCDCGNEVELYASRLRGSRSRPGVRSCGCLLDEWRNNQPIKSINDINGTRLYNLYRRAAILRGYKFCLSVTEVAGMILQPCHYCGATGSMSWSLNRKQGGQDRISYNGIDRVDNSLGYSISNCVPCCKMCNNIKKAYTLDVLMDWVARIHKHMKGHQHGIC